MVFNMSQELESTSLQFFMASLTMDRPELGRCFITFSNIIQQSRNDLLYFTTCNQFFPVQDCCSQIVQVEYQGQTQKNRILKDMPLINTSSHSIQIGVEIFSLCTIFAQCSNRKSKLGLSTLITTGLSNIAFHLLQIWLQSLVAID